MLEPITALMARDRTAAQFAERRNGRPAEAPAALVAPRAPVRRTGARVLRTLADRIEPAPRCVPQG
jgi:hypothetical protein